MEGDPVHGGLMTYGYRLAKLIVEELFSSLAQDSKEKIFFNNLIFFSKAF